MENLIEQIWQQYINLNPDALKIHQLLEGEGEKIQNDHVAFRTLASNDYGVKAHQDFFEKYGYQAKGEYHFKQKKLYAIHLEHENPAYPKMFISELLIPECDSRVQEVMNDCLKQMQGKSFSDVFLNGAFWVRNHKTFQELAPLSEYAAWFYNHGFCANHFTVNINALKKFDGVSDINVWLKEKGFVLNSSGGEIKGGESDLLEQSSTLSSEIDLDFADGTFKVPGCYYEFAKRFPDASGELFQGFVTQSADKIFESTDQQR